MPQPFASTAKFTRGLAILLSLALVVVSIELALHGLFMYRGWVLSGPETLERYNLFNRCDAEPQQQTPHKQYAEHGPLCFVQLLPADELEPADSSFSNIHFSKFQRVGSAWSRRVLAQNILARAPPVSPAVLNITS